MHPNKKPRTFDNFRDFGNKMNRQEPTPQEQNNAQLINWLGEIKQTLDKISRDLSDYRMKQADERLYMRDFITGIMKDRKSAEEMMTMILEHLTRPYSPPAQTGDSQPWAQPAWASYPKTKPIPDAIDIDKMIADKADESAITKENIHELGNGEKTKKFERITYETRLDIMILELLKYGIQCTVPEMVKFLQEQHPGLVFKKGSVSATLTNLISQGKISRVERGIYKAVLED